MPRNRHRRAPWGRAGLLVAGLLIAVSASVGLGAVSITPGDLVGILGERLGLTDGPVDARQAAVLMGIRLPRVITSGIVGALLGIAGALMQARYRSGLADPVLVGIGAGAAFGAALGTVLLLTVGSGSSAVVATTLPGGEVVGVVVPLLLAIGGALVASVLVAGAAGGAGRATVPTMLLAGIALGALFTSVTGILTFAIHDPRLRDTGFWTLGGLAGVTWRVTIPTIVALGACALAGWRLAPGLDALSLGEEEAAHLGVDPRSLGRATGVVVVLATGTAVAAAGPVAFVALLAPAAARRMLGSGTRLTLVGSALAGAIALTVADLAARSIASPAELPVGLITAAVGAPAFLWLLRRDRAGSAP
ncbi:MAG: FecCD family ABC transporter permease [Chloroflexota bacterium]